MTSSKTSKAAANIKAGKLKRRLDRVHREAVQLRDVWASSEAVENRSGKLGLKDAKKVIEYKVAAEKRAKKRKKNRNRKANKAKAKMQADHNILQNNDEAEQAMDIEQDIDGVRESQSEDDSGIEDDSEADEVTEAEQHIKREDNLESEPEIKVEQDSDHTYIAQHDEARGQGRAAWPRLPRAPASVDLIEYSRELSAHFQTIKAVINDGGGDEGTIELPRREISYLAERTHLVLDSLQTIVDVRMQTFDQMHDSTEAT